VIFAAAGTPSRQSLTRVRHRYRRGGTLSISATELFQKLDLAEQELLKSYFYTRVEIAKTEFPELAKDHSKVF
jgi:hypothetical protein